MVVVVEGPGGTLVLFLAAFSCCHCYGKVQLSLDEAFVLHTGARREVSDHKGQQVDSA